MSTTEVRGGGAGDGTQPRRRPSGGDGVALRLLWPQWQGAGTSSVRGLAPEFPFDGARRGYAVGSAVLAAVLSPHDGPTAAVPVAMDDAGLELGGGIEAKQAILTQLVRALETIRAHDPARIVTLGGECAVSVAPLASSPAATVTASRSSGSTRTPTSARPRAGTPGSMPWLFRR